MRNEADCQRPHPHKPIVVRRVRPQFDAVEDRVWFAGNQFRTAVFNAYTLLLCEEFELVAIAGRYLPQITDEPLKKQLKAWLAQEASHGVQHRKACSYLDRMSLRYRGYQKIENFLAFRIIFPLLSKKFRIALIAGLEHFNTMIGEMCLARPDYFDHADKELSLLLQWHFAEEIEHRAVIHDVAQAAGMGYCARVATGLLAFLLYAGFLFITALWFAIQSTALLRPATYLQAFRFMFTEERFVQYFSIYLRAYLSPRFHPLTRESDRFSEPVFQRLAATATGKRS